MKYMAATRIAGIIDSLLIAHPRIPNYFTLGNEIQVDDKKDVTNKQKIKIF